MANPENTSKWGLKTAKERYGPIEDSKVTPAPSQQAPQDPEDKHGAKYDNDHKSDWVRGYGSKMHTYFDSSPSRSKLRR